MIKGKEDFFEIFKNSMLESMNLLSLAIEAELEEQWDIYIDFLRSLPDSAKKELNDKFGVSSLDDIGVKTLSKSIEEQYISFKIGVDPDRDRDARILEYVYGKKTPFSSLLTKLTMKDGPTNLIRKHGLA